MQHDEPSGSDDMYDDTSASSSLSAGFSSDDDDLTWIQWYCRQRGNEFLCEVDDAYIRDGFNLSGLSSQVPYYEHALDALLETEGPDVDHLTDQQQEVVDSAAELLYGMIHARYILTSRGLHAMRIKYEACDFGKCPRFLCRGQRVLPVGRADLPCQDGVYIYCPMCGDIYTPKSSRTGSLDGAYFGRTFPHLFFMVYPSLVPSSEVSPDVYAPRIYGFRVADRSMLRAADGKKRGDAQDEKRRVSGGTGAGAGAGGGASARGAARAPQARADFSAGAIFAAAVTKTPAATQGGGSRHASSSKR